MVTKAQRKRTTTDIVLVQLRQEGFTPHQCAAAERAIGLTYDLLDEVAKKNMRQLRRKLATAHSVWRKIDCNCYPDAADHEAGCPRARPS